jgi:hypothetical protein
VPSIAGGAMGTPPSIVIPTSVVIPSEARDLGFCLKTQW